MAIKDNLKRLRLKSGFTQAQVAEALEITRPSVTQWESGWSLPKMGHIEKLAALYGVSKSEILGEARMSKGFAEVPLLGRIAAGDPITMENLNVDVREAPARFIAEDPKAFLLKVDGESVNRIIPDGSYALISPKQKEPNEHDLFAVCVNGHDATIKHVKRLANGFMLIPDSHDSTFRPTVYDYNEETTETITIIGKVVWWCAEY